MTRRIGPAEAVLLLAIWTVVIWTIVSGAILGLTFVATDVPAWAESAARCGVERWDVKIGTDQEAERVDIKEIRSTTITEMRAWPVPPAHLHRRTWPYETSVWKVQGVLIAYKREADSDYHLVITDKQHQGTIIVELPSPACARRSLWVKDITAARAAFDARFTATRTLKYTSTPVVITGVGFFDVIHGQTGVAPNGIELHPVLEISFP